ncbi:MAG: HD-GYP domain-containing protein [Deferrisomatales bacterium]|nr:HD-GYP domain-containing protein [Deferrisomatales bacterium]
MAEGRACAECGTPILGPPFARRGDAYVCEGCFLTGGEPEEVRTGPEAPCLPLPAALATALDVRERETGLHSRRVACYAVALMRAVTEDPLALRQMYWGALLHDIGKIGVPDAILLKPGPLTEPEWAQMKTHPEKGHAMLAGAGFLAGAAEIVLTHEERYDGSGYPQGLAGDAIPLGARLFAIVDALDAMTSERPYRAKVSFEMARADIVRGAGSQFAPAAVEAFHANEAILRELVSLKCGELVLPGERVGP